MLKVRTISLRGRDDCELQLTELPALVADRYARVALRAIGEEPAGGVVALAFKYLHELQQRTDATDLLQPFVGDAGANLADWRNVGRLQQHALALHVDFLLDREAVEIPVAMQADRILQSLPDVNVTFCSPHIAAVLSSRLATYRELETVLSTEDVFNLLEVLSVDNIRDWHAHQLAKEA